MSIQGQGNFLTLVHGHLCIKIKTFFSEKSNQILYVSFKEMKIYDNGHMTKMGDMPIYSKNLLKSFVLGTCGSISTKLGV